MALTATSNKYNVLIVFILYCKTLAVIEVDTGRLGTGLVVWVGLMVG